ncbi:ADP-ribose pyrophosphatase YjhB (NUDIX family) [Catenuloplanes nepalensis]|uniref:ADP-ribose pyrophosphatase YjhB (NUDIX family) n=1 Tax=Catenuloplanes nepalensis TaxID=587533 RepID=A0ABT9N709_9ACTN|nr:ADP-ribose pyrophosphatase YjhB (NUDIX family) [Catenuloplanes nepalensis]
MDIGETLSDCIVREVEEETGLDIEITGLVGIYSDPQHVIAYADSEVRQEFNITYYGRVISGNLAVSDESTDVRFIDPAEFDRIPIHDTVRLRLRHHAEHRATPSSDSRARPARRSSTALAVCRRVARGNLTPGPSQNRT